MSVWDEICYTTDTLTTYLRQINQWDVDDKVMPQLCTDSYHRNVSVGNQLPEGRLTDTIIDNLRYAKIIEPQSFTKPIPNAQSFISFLSEGRITTSESAVAALMSKIHKHEIRWANEWDWKWLQAFTHRMLRFNQYASYQSQHDADDYLTFFNIYSNWAKKMRQYDNMAETFTHLWYGFNAASERTKRRLAERDEELPEPLKDSIVSLGKKWAARKFGSLLILTEETNDTPVHYILTRKDVNRIHQMCSSLADMELYFSHYVPGIASSPVYTLFHQVLQMIMDALGSGHRVGEVPRACDVAAALLLSYNADDIWNKSIVDQEAKIKNEALDDVLDVKMLTQIFMKLPLAEAVELSKVYKFLPVPDFDFLTLFEAQRQKHMETRPAFYDNELGLHLPDFQLYQRHQLVITYHANYGKCPGSIKESAIQKPWHITYPYITPHLIPYLETTDIELRGALPYEQITSLDNPYIKDKALAPNYVSTIKDSIDMNNVPGKDRNYLLHYLFSDILATPEQVGLGMSEERHEICHTAAPKGETKKKWTPRNFYINNYPGRVLLSEIENNIARWISKKPGCFTGLSHAQAFNKFQDITGPDLDHYTHKYVFISFDLAAWSPKQSPELRKLQLAKWAEIFDKDYITAADQQFSIGKVHYIRKGIHQEYKLKGNDLEGYLGRLNTDLHVDIMGYAVNKLRRAGYIDRGSKLAVQIDDGLCVLRFTNDTPDTRIVQAVELLEKIYAWFSLEISWDKTYVSRYLRVFLNELDYEKVRITPGIKAFLRIRRGGDLGIRCFLREHNKAAGHVASAMQAGCNGHVAWLKYALELGKGILDWHRRRPRCMTGDEAALWAFIPIAFGGCGALSLLQHSCNATEDGTAAGLSVLKAIATYEPRLRVPINTFINQPLKQKTKMGLLRDPTKFKIEGPTFTDLLEVPYAKRALRKGAKHPLVQEALAISDTFADSDAYYEIGDVGNTRGKALTLGYNASLLSYLDSLILKFTRSSTIIQLIGSYNALLIYKRYRTQFNRVYDSATVILRS